MIGRIFPYSIVTDRESISIYIYIYIYIYIICKPENCAPDWAFRDVLFGVIITNDVLHRFDTSHKSWEKYGVRKEI